MLGRKEAVEVPHREVEGSNRGIKNICTLEQAHLWLVGSVLCVRGWRLQLGAKMEGGYFVLDQCASVFASKEAQMRSGG